MIKPFAIAGLLVLGAGGPVVAETAKLAADLSADTYRHINWTLAPDGNAVEVPDCGHGAFGPHITQVHDGALGKAVFRFHIHRDHDDDRCKKADRQRVEIKVYSHSPEWLKAKPRDIFTYRWKFKLDRAFQPSRRFTHIHQLKAVGGTEAAMPLITLTARKGRSGKPDRFELRYAEHDKQRTAHWVELKPFLGRWVEVVEQVRFGERGTYSLNISDLETTETIFAYSNSSLRMWKSGARFLRPKWGIYRSLKDRHDLRDETVDFADFEITY